jgi:hypothetical protein
MSSPHSYTKESKEYIWIGPSYTYTFPGISNQLQIELLPNTKYNCQITKFYKCRTILKKDYNKTHPLRYIKNEGDVHPIEEVISVSQEEYDSYYEANIMGGVISKDTPFEGYTDIYWDIYFIDIFQVITASAWLCRSLRMYEKDGFENHFITLQEWRDKQIDKFINK